MKILAAFFASLLLALCAHAGDSLRSGIWSGDVRGEMLHLQLRSDHNQMGLTVPVASLKGVTKNELASGSSDVRFEIVEAAGTLSFDGHVRNAIGAGEYRFTPNAAFVREMQSLGYSLRDDELLFFTVEHFRPETLRDLRALGITPSRQELMEVVVFKITPGVVREYAALGYPHLREIVQFRALKITPEFVQKLAAAAHAHLTPQQLIEYKVAANIIAEKPSEDRRRAREQR